MGFNIKIILFIGGLCFLLVVLKFIKNKVMNPSFAILWFIIALFMLSIPVFEGLYTFISHNLLQLNDATNSIYIVLFCFLLSYLFYLTIKFSRLSNQVQLLISYTSLLENKIRELSEDDRLEHDN